MATIMNREEIVNGLVSVGKLGAKAEGWTPDELRRATLLIPGHLSALEPDILLIVGGRGAGKTHLFRLVNLPDLASVPEIRERRHLQNAAWVRGFSAQPGFETTSPVRLPDESSVQSFAIEKNTSELIGFWRGLLVGAILASADLEAAAVVSAHLPDDLLQSLALDRLKRISVWHPQIMKHPEDVSSALDALDDWLAEKNRYLFVTYDDLDVMAVDWAEKRNLIRALLQFWLGQWRRWQRIRPKIFLRLDLFSAEFLDFPDASKLQGNRYILRWNPAQLYQLVFKVWANSNDASREFLTRNGLLFQNTPVLKWMYTSPLPDDQALRHVVHELMGEFMGKDLRRGVHLSGYQITFKMPMQRYFHAAC